MAGSTAFRRSGARAVSRSVPGALGLPCLTSPPRDTIVPRPARGHPMRCVLPLLAVLSLSLAPAPPLASGRRNTNELPRGWAVEEIERATPPYRGAGRVGGDEQEPSQKGRKR